MEATQEVLMGLILTAFGQGAGALVSVSTSNVTTLRTRYLDWLVTVKPGNTQTPSEVWDKMGADFLSQFRTIGQLSAGASLTGTISDADLLKFAMEVEDQAPCPFCP
jgi:hypothetical protein